MLGPDSYWGALAFLVSTLHVAIDRRSVPPAPVPPAVVECPVLELAANQTAQEVVCECAIPWLILALVAGLVFALALFLGCRCRATVAQVDSPSASSSAALRPPKGGKGVWGGAR